MGLTKGPYAAWSVLAVIAAIIAAVVYEHGRLRPERQTVERPCYMPSTWLLLDDKGVPEKVVYKDIRRIPFCEGETCRVHEQVSYTVLIQSEDPVEVERFCSYEGR